MNEEQNTNVAQTEPQTVAEWGAYYGNEFNKLSPQDVSAKDYYQAFKKYGSGLKQFAQERGLSVEDTNTFFQAYTDSVMKHVDNKTPWYERIGDQYNRMAAGGNSAMSSIMRSVGDVDNDYGWESDAKAQRERISFQSQFNDLYNADLTAARKASGENGFKAWFGTAKDSVLRGDVSAITNPIVDNAAPVAAAIGANLVGTGLAPVTGGASLATTGTLTATAFGAMGAGEYRQDIAESYDEIYKNNPHRLLELPEIQERIAQGMTLEQAYKDARGDFSDNIGGIAAAAGIGMAESLLPVAKIGRGVTRGVLGTGLKEVGGEVAQELAQQGVNNLGKGYVDGKTQWDDNFGETAAQALVAGGAFAVPSMLDARHNGKKSQNDEVEQVLNNSHDTPSETQKQPQSPVNGTVLDNILSAYKEDNARYDELYSDLKSDIEDGRLQQRLKESDREYADLARAYLEQTGQLQSESAVENEQVFADTEVKTTEPEQETTQPVFDEDRLEQYRQASQDIVSAYQRGDITEREVNSRYADIIQRYPEHQQLAQELYRRQQEDQEQQVLYSRSPMKSVEANIARGRERMTQAILDKADVKRGMYNGEFGWVDFVWGDDGLTKPFNKKGEPVGKGIAHIIEARMRKDGMSYAQAARMLIDNIVEAIAKGKAGKVWSSPNGKDLSVQIDHNGYRVALAKRKGSNSWIITGFKLHQTGVNGVGGDTSATTHVKPTLTRQNVGAVDVFEDANRKGYDKSIPTITSPTLPRADKGAPNVASDSGQFANPNGLSNDTALELGRPTSISQLNDTHAHSQRGRGVVAENVDNLANSAQVVNQIAQDQQTLSRLLGDETASHIQVVDRNTEIPSGKDVKKLISDGVEGWFEISTKKLYLISDNITADETLSRDERLAWVAWHELAHAGVRVKYGDILTRILAAASENTVVKVIARKIQQDRGDISYPVAVEEALVEIYAAYETGNWAALENRYKTKIHESYKQGKNSVADHLTKIANYIRKLMNLIFRSPKFTEKMTTSDVFNTLSGIKEGINTLADSQQEQTVQDDVRYSFAGQKARNADTQQMGRAMARLQNGENPEIIRQETGWFKGVDGRMRFEIMDNPELITPYDVYEDFLIENEFTEREFHTTLGEVWKDEALFESYPHLRSSKVVIKPFNTESSAQGYFNPQSNEIVLSADLNSYQMRDVLAHEVQHRIQSMEGFLNGNSPDLELSRMDNAIFTGNQNVDRQLAELQQELTQTADPKRQEAIQDEINSYRKMVADNRYQRSVGEVEARNVTTRLNLTAEERRNRSPESTEDIKRENQIARDAFGNTVFSLNENSDSDFAKAVDDFIDGNEVKTSISMGTTPTVLKMIGLPDVEVKIQRKTLGKVMRGKHAIEPEILKQLPQQLNDPVGVFQSSPHSSNPDGYVVLTELTEFNEENNRDEPVIVALHLDQTGEVQLIEIASAYGKNHQGLQNILNKDKVYYWNKTKGSQLANVHWLQLPLKLRSEANLSANNIKTETDLSQYQSENAEDIEASSESDIRYSRKPSVLEQ
ncbi:MuF-C-terminal domain-containing protein, partial [Rodentibacter genomosp. 2]|uniref:MuF-C-terminal domain-containing protein n=1 Tax=Rodentibacter genomosp. 2 TaxID=1908266 RepID=UPI001C4DE840